MSFDEQFLDDLVAAMREVKLEAVIVGNAASILHGAPILTQDVDILVRNTPLNQKKLRRLAEILGGIGPDEISGLTNVRRILGSAVPIDVLFNQMAGVRFESVRARAVKISTGNEIAMVASLEDVIKSKEKAGRKKDIAVLPILRDTLAVKKLLKLMARAIVRKVGANSLKSLRS